MDGIVPRMSRSDKRRLEKRCRKLKDGDQKTRYLIILNLADGRSVADTARALKVDRSTIYRVAARFREEGVDGLVDHREENGETKLCDEFLSTLWEVVESCPLDHGWKRPTWTREMLVITMERKTGIRIHVSTMSVALSRIGARRGRPKPIVESTWSKQAKNKRLRELRELVEDLPDDEVVVYEDEVDVHLNPKIGLDWMVKGQQKEVLHFLPPYCPDHNKIERAWQDLHANVTCNHKCSDMSELMKNVRYYLRQRNKHKAQYATAA